MKNTKKNKKKIKLIMLKILLTKQKVGKNED